MSGYPVAAIKACSQFKRTHNFLIEAWQALYLVMLQRYIEAEREEGISFLELTQSSYLHLKSSNFVATLTQLRERLKESMLNFSHLLTKWQVKT